MRAFHFFAFDLARSNTPYNSTRWGNDEADPLVGWEKIEPWRADARYPAMVVKTIRQHLDFMVYSEALQGLEYDILSNDNAFINYPDNGQHTFTQVGTRNKTQHVCEECVCMCA